MSLPHIRFTYADYCLLPEDKRYELLEGELLMTPAPTTRHQRIHMRLVTRLSDENVVQPDALFIASARLAIIDEKGVRGAPDLVAEILSPSTATRDQVLKRKLYSKFGVRECWILDPASNTVDVLTQSEAGLTSWRTFAVGDTLQSPLLPDLRINVADLFPH